MSLTRRKLIGGGAAAGAGLLLSGCDRIVAPTAAHSQR